MAAAAGSIHYAAGPANATLTDTTINSSTLDSSRVFTQAVTLTIPTENDFNGTAAAGFFARNIMITTPTIDYSPYLAGNFRNFVVFSSEDMGILNSLTLSAFNNHQIFFAGGTLSISPGVTISGNAPSIEFGGRNSLNFNSVSFVNTGGEISLDTFNDITLNGVSINSSAGTGANSGSFVSISTDNSAVAIGSISLNNTTITGDGVDISSAGNLTLTASTPSAGQVSGANSVDLFGATGLTVGVNVASQGQTSGGIFLGTSTGTLTVNNGAQLAASAITMNSGADVLVDSIAPPSANSLNISAATTGTIQNTDLSGVQNASISGHTRPHERRLAQLRQHLFHGRQRRPGSQSQHRRCRRSRRPELHQKRHLSRRAGKYRRRRLQRRRPEWPMIPCPRRNLCCVTDG